MLKKIASFLLIGTLLLGLVAGIPFSAGALATPERNTFYGYGDPLPDGSTNDFLSFYLHEPEIDDPQKVYPLVLVLPSSGGFPHIDVAGFLSDNMVSTIISDYEDCYILMPKCDSVIHYEHRDTVLTNLKAIIDGLAAAQDNGNLMFRFDPDRYYTVGFSQGGYMTWKMNETYPDFFAAMVPIEWTVYIGVYADPNVEDRDDVEPALSAEFESYKNTLQHKPVFGLYNEHDNYNLEAAKMFDDTLGVIDKEAWYPEWFDLSYWDDKGGVPWITEESSETPWEDISFCRNGYANPPYNFDFPHPEDFFRLHGEGGLIACDANPEFNWQFRVKCGEVSHAFPPPEKYEEALTWMFQQQMPTGMSLNKSSITMNVGDSDALAATVLPVGKTDTTVIWTSSHPDIAAVDEDGNVTGVGPGDAVITAETMNGKTATASVRVDTNVVRLFGTNRINTALAISRSAWDNTSDSVVLVNANSFPDGLSAATLAAYTNSPILLTNGTSLESENLTRLDEIDPSIVYVCGSSASISSSIFDSLEQWGFGPVRVTAGTNRYDQNMATVNKYINVRGSKPATAVIVTGADYPDTISISPYAAMKGYPVIYANPVTGLSAAAQAYLGSGVTDIIIAGGTGSVTSVTIGQLNSLGIPNNKITRYFGSNSFGTSMAINNAFSDEFGSDVMFTTGNNYPDAVSGVVLAAKLQTPLILTDTDSNPLTQSAIDFIIDRRPGTAYVLGGTGTIPDSWISDVLDQIS